MSFFKHTFSAAACSLLLVCIQPAFATPQEDAGALFTAQNWSGAVTAYQTLLQVDDTSASNTFRLGRALHNTDNFKEARNAYEKALKLEMARPLQARYHLARSYMSLGQEEKALSQLEKIADAGGFSFRHLQSTAEFASLENDPTFKRVISTLTPCNTPEFKQFSFWLGEWDVQSVGSPAPTATNSLTSVHDGCVMLEQYVAGAFTGMSLNFYDTTTKKWHQTWNSNSGGALYLEGGLNENGEMVLSDEGFETSKINKSINRITWTANPDESVRQFWQNSSDDGKTWTVSFDGLYTHQKAKLDE